MTVVVMGFCFDRVAAGLDELAKVYLIAACDTMLSDAFYGATVQDSGVCKVQAAGMFSPWLIGYCDNPEHFLPIRAKYAAKLSPLSGNSDVSEAEFLEILKQSYQDYRNEEIAERILRPTWQIASVQELKSLEHSNPITYANLWPQVQGFDLELTLCAGGFSKTTGPQLRIISNPGHVSKNLAPILPGTVAIGSGDDHAQRHLRLWYDKGASLKEALYYILESKFIADMDVPTVGVATDLIITQYNPRAQPNNTPFRVSRERVAEFQDAWKAERRNPSQSLVKLLDIEPLFNF
jgi:hypothetical protein